MVWPLSSVTTNGEPVDDVVQRGRVGELPPSATMAAEALRVTTVGIGIIGDGGGDGGGGGDGSKLPPEVPLMATSTVWCPGRRQSSARTLKAALVPMLWPTGIVMVWPLFSVTTNGEPVTALLSVAV